MRRKKKPATTKQPLRNGRSIVIRVQTQTQKIESQYADALANVRRWLYDHTYPCRAVNKNPLSNDGFKLRHFIYNNRCLLY